MSQSLDMSRPQAPGVIPGTLPAHIRAYGFAACNQAGVLVRGDMALRSSTTQQPLTYKLGRTSEVLTVEYHQCTQRGVSLGRGLLIASGARQITMPHIIAPISGQRMRFRFWLGPEKGFADNTWETAKTPLRLDTAAHEGTADPTGSEGAQPRDNEDHGAYQDIDDSASTLDNGEDYQSRSVPDNFSSPTTQGHDISSGSKRGPSSDLPTPSKRIRYNHASIGTSTIQEPASTLQTARGDEIQVRFLKTKKIVRKRPWRECHPSGALFSQAVVAELLKSSSDERPLKVTIVIFHATGEFEERIWRLMKGDERDSRSLIKGGRDAKTSLAIKREKVKMEEIGNSYAQDNADAQEVADLVPSPLQKRISIEVRVL